MAEKSLVEYAFDVLSKEKGKTSFKVIFNKLSKLAGLGELSEEEAKVVMSKLYTQLSLDGRFAVFAGNYWDLSSRVKFDDRHIDMSEAYSDVESDTSDDQEEAEELKEEIGGDADEEANEAEESDDLDFDKSKTSNESEEEF